MTFIQNLVKNKLASAGDASSVVGVSAFVSYILTQMSLHGTNFEWWIFPSEEVKAAIVGCSVMLSIWFKPSNWPIIANGIIEYTCKAIRFFRKAKHDIEIASNEPIEEKKDA